MALFLLAISAILLLILCLIRVRMVSQGEKFAKVVQAKLGHYQQLFGDRADARQFVSSVIERANRTERYKPGGTGAIGARIGGGDFAGAALLAVGKVAVDGAVDLVGRLARGLFRAGERVVAGDGAKSEEQARWELFIREDLDRLLAVMLAAAKLKVSIFVIGGFGVVCAIVVAIQAFEPTGFSRIVGNSFAVRSLFFGSISCDEISNRGEG